jgi:hypothetical protein
MPDIPFQANHNAINYLSRLVPAPTNPDDLDLHPIYGTKVAYRELRGQIH